MTIKTFIPPGPVVKAWMEDESRVRFLMGPMGSGKTAGACVEILRRSMLQAPGQDNIRHTRWVCIRNTFSELKMNTIKSWQQWAPLEFGKFTIGGSPITHRITVAPSDGQPGLDMEVFFIPLDDDAAVKKLLGLELTGAWIDEAREVPESVLKALTGRVNRFPSAADGGATWTGIMLTTNPPDTEHWLYKVYTNLEEINSKAKPEHRWAFYRQPSGLASDAENIQNLTEHRGYYEAMCVNKDPEWVRVFVHGDFGFMVEGQVVYPSFRDSVHVPPAKVEPLPGLPLVLGADWGLTPACAICQQWPDGRILVVEIGRASCRERVCQYV